MDLGNTTVKVSDERLRTASENIMKSVLHIRSLLNDAVCTGERAFESWQGSSAEEFKARCRSFDLRIDNTTSDMIKSVDLLKKILGVYQETEKLVKEKGADLSGDVIS